MILFDCKVVSDIEKPVSENIIIISAYLRKRLCVNSGKRAIYIYV